MNGQTHRVSNVALLGAATALLLAAVTAPALAQTAEDVQVELSRLASDVSNIMPEDWRIVEARAGETPIGWTGEASGLLVMAEDTRTRFFHPNGFHYYSFYRVWLMPSGWEGVMRHTPYVSDSVPAYLLGANDDYVAFYHTAGGNVWPEGPESMCQALGLDRICYTDLTRRIVDMEIEERLTTGAEETGYALNPKRIVGLAGEGPNLYMEYVFPAEDGEEEADLLASVTDKLAGSVFARIPEAESLYLRRCTNDTYTDTIVTRS